MDLTVMVPAGNSISIQRLDQLSILEKKKLLTRDTLHLSSIINETIEPMAAEFEKSPWQALQKYSQKFDGATPLKPLLYQQDLEEKYHTLYKRDPALINAFQQAANHIRSFHQQQLQSGYKIEVGGNELSFLYRPMQSVALYVPGGKAVYPSTVLMGVIPAKIAGVKNLTLLSPPSAETGEVNEVVQAVAYLAGVKQILQYGGAQAILAAAYGIYEMGLLPHDFIAGPGNIYVAAAKSHVFTKSLCGIDSFAGPSEVVIIADNSADKNHLAHDLMAQAEHDENASAILLTDDASLAEAVAAEIEKILSHRSTLKNADLKRLAITRKSVSQNGRILIVPNLNAAVEFSNQYAPEHLEIQTNQDDELCEKIVSAGSIFLGRYSPVAVGDYFSGTNHILPTGGAARFASGVSVLSYLKRITVQKCSPAGLYQACDPVALMSKAEGLFDEHGYSLLARFEEKMQQYEQQ